ncbi:uncharacterized protein MKK02DRAFT_41002 [Dioszegia hungarica]|uniref:Uncharacterized protein n=1 Tax=Dioszegia hungarica TaxID=4972 RepID=A0AA38H250_9TREE|nr:uncharacterized protein MKK02DRAFT_41002 [Dioszegia hungarica]KAI9632693.1 hypothetical protein MKK02DRAFT_41002 [Dioszegia hungarica]
MTAKQTPTITQSESLRTQLFENIARKVIDQAVRDWHPQGMRGNTSDILRLLDASVVLTAYENGTNVDAVWTSNTFNTNGVDGMTLGSDNRWGQVGMVARSEEARTAWEEMREMNREAQVEKQERKDERKEGQKERRKERKDERRAVAECPKEMVELMPLLGGPAVDLWKSEAAKVKVEKKAKKHKKEQKAEEMQPAPTAVVPDLSQQTRLGLNDATAPAPHQLVYIGKRTHASAGSSSIKASLDPVHQPVERKSKKAKGAAK